MSISRERSDEPITAHSLAAKAMHWGFIGVFIYALTKQLDEVEELEDFSLLQQEMLFAAAFLVLLILRFVFMHATRPSALPRNTPRRERLLARSVHLAMYVGLALIAISGMAIGALYWSGIKSGVSMDIALITHEIAVNGSYTLILCHVAAAIYHRWKGDGIWNAMVPVWKEPDRD